VRLETRVACALGQPAGEQADVVRRLIDQLLIRQEMERSGVRAAAGGEPQVDAAAARRCGVAEKVVRESLTRRGHLLAFVDARLRPLAQVSSEAVEKYYREELLPDLRRQNAAEPSLEAVREKITALLTERQMNELLAAWLDELHRREPIRIR
jgi:enoyl-CoA hydratase/carnithine racemase